MLDTIEKPAGTEFDLGQQPSKRDLVEAALRADAARSDREIARQVGCDHKTVGSARERLGIASPLGNSNSPAPSTAPEDFDHQHKVDAAVQLVHNMQGSKCPPPPGVVDEPKYDPFAPDSEDMVIPHQPAIAVYENTVGAVVIRQVATVYDEEDPVIQVRPEHVEKLIARLRYVAKGALS
jgi:hypothetical protein